jgi:hypothetical protein
VTHNGGSGVFVAELLRFVDDGVTIFMTSTVSQMTASSAVSSAAGTYTLADGSRLVIRAEEGRVMAEAVGQQAYQLLASGDTASLPNATALNAKSRAIGLDSADMAQQESQLMEGRRERFGTFQSIDVLGTIPGPEGGLQTTVRLNFDRGGATNVYTWDRENKIIDLGARPYAPVELMWAADDGLRSFDARTGTGARFTISGEALIAQTPNGSVRASRKR